MRPDVGRRRFWSAWGLAALLTLASSAIAEETGHVEPVPVSQAVAPLTVQLRGEALQDYQAARAFYDLGDYAGALLKFQRSYQLSGDPRLLWNSASCEKSLRHYAKAMLWVRRFLASASPLVTPEARTRAQAFLEAAELLTARLELESNAPGAKLYVDSEFVGTLPLDAPVRVDPGAHHVAVKHSNFQPFEEDLVVAGSHVQLTAILTPIPGVPRKIPAPNQPSGAERGIPSWIWIGGSGALLAGLATAGYFAFRRSERPIEPIPGTIDTFGFAPP